MKKLRGGIALILAVLLLLLPALAWGEARTERRAPGDWPRPLSHSRLTRAGETAVTLPQARQSQELRLPAAAMHRAQPALPRLFIGRQLARESARAMQSFCLLTINHPKHAPPARG